MKMKKVVFVEPSSTHLHVYSRFTIPRLGSVLLGTIMRDRGYDANGEQVWGADKGGYVFIKRSVR